MIFFQMGFLTYFRQCAGVCKGALLACLLLALPLAVTAQSTSVMPQAPEENQTSLDPASPLALQTEPIYLGVENFQSRIEQVRKNEGREPLGLVLTGGSARAFCHIGVLKSLEENGVVPDFIVANSMGAIIGFLYAHGFSPEAIGRIVSEINLSDYFEIVGPFHGGIISVRKFEEMVRLLFDKENVDIKDCAIPVLILTEDLVSKRQVWHGEGDLPQILVAAFAMTFFMEPVKFELPGDTTKTTKKARLMDSGTIDLGGIGVAAEFSENLIVSSAFYDKVVNLSNPLTILSRSFSVGKERVAVKDILRHKPLLIRNDVENFSFMDFQKISQITQAGYESAARVSEHVLALPHANKIDIELRRQHDTLAEKFISAIKRNPALNTQKVYVNTKLWPQFSATDFPDSYLFDMYGLALSLFCDYKWIFAKVQANQPFLFNETRAEAQIVLTPSSVFSAQIFGSYGFSFSDFSKNNFLGFAEINLRPKQFPLWLEGFFATGEARTDYKFHFNEFIATAGLKFFWGQPVDSFLLVTPFAFSAGDDESLLGKLPESVIIGGGG